MTIIVHKYFFYNSLSIITGTVHQYHFCSSLSTTTCMHSGVTVHQCHFHSSLNTTTCMQYCFYSSLSIITITVHQYHFCNPLNTTTCMHSGITVHQYHFCSSLNTTTCTHSGGRGSAARDRHEPCPLDSRGTEAAGAVHEDIWCEHSRALGAHRRVHP